MKKVDARRFFVPGKPVGKARPRFSRKSGTVYQPKTNSDYEKLVKESYLQAWEGLDPYDGSVSVLLDIRFAPNKSDTKRVRIDKLEGRIPVTKKPDIDNVIKIVLDALNGIAFIDDAQVITVTASKRYATEEREGIIVMLEEKQ